MKKMTFEQGSPEWLEWRRSGIGSTDIVAIMGKSPWATAFDVYSEKIGLAPERKQNQWMKRGSDLEPVVREWFEAAKGQKYSASCIKHSEVDYFIASLDGYNEETNEIVEIKVPKEEVIEMARKGKIPEHYELQCQWQLMCTGAKKLYFVVRADDISYECVEVEPDYLLHEEMKEKAHEFWKNTTTGILPEEQPDEVLLVEDERLEELSKEWEGLMEEIKLREKRKKEIAAQMVDFGDDGDFMSSRLVFKKQQGIASYDYKRMKLDGIDLDKYKKLGMPFYKIQVKK